MQRSLLARGAAVLALALLAACQDNPAGTAPEVQPQDLTALHAEAPVLTVSNSGGYPLISWSALSGATSYSVVYRRTRTVIYKSNFYTETDDFDYALGSTSGTSFLDTSHTYTGVSRCISSGTFASVWIMDTYRVTATYADGTSATGTVNAPVVPC